MLTRRPLLVIEDSNDDYLILETCLRAVGVKNRLARCSNGAEIDAFLENAKSLPTSQIPTFIFLDLNLPGAQGAEVLQRLKDHPTLSPIPVVVLTTSSRRVDVDESYRRGAAGFLTKPIELSKFEQMVQRVADYWFACVKLPENVGPER